MLKTWLSCKYRMDTCQRFYSFHELMREPARWWGWFKGHIGTYPQLKWCWNEFANRDKTGECFMGHKSVTCACVLSHFSRIWLCATPWTVACQDPLSMGILQARTLKWVAMLSSSGPSWPRDWTCVFCTSFMVRRVLYPPGKPPLLPVGSAFLLNKKMQSNI